MQVEMGCDVSVEIEDRKRVSGVKRFYELCMYERSESRERKECYGHPVRESDVKGKNDRAKKQAN